MVSVPSPGSTSTRRCSFASARPSARTAVVGPAPSTARYVRHPKPGTGSVATTTSRTGARRWRIAMVAPDSPSASSSALVASRSSSGSPGAASWKVNSTVPSSSVRRSTSAMRAPASSGPRIISSTHRIFWPDDDGGDPLARRGASPPAWGTRRRRRPRRGARDPRRAAGRSTTPARVPRGAVHHDGRRRRRVDRGRERAERVAGERLADVARLLVAHADRLDDLVGAARARRVVRAVEDELLPADVEQRVRVGVGREEQRAERLGARARGCVRRGPRPGARRRGSTPRP